MFRLRLENENGNIVDVNDCVNYVVVSVSGLLPPAASIFTAKSPNRKGVKYNGSSLDARNIILQVKLLGDVEQNRNALYAWIDTEQYVKVYYQNGVKNVYCEGHIEDCEGDLFTDNEVISISIICENPYWKHINEIVTDISKLMKQFSFPFAINADGVPFSSMRDGAASVYYDGAETGVKIVVRFHSTVEGFTIFDSNDLTRIFKVKNTFNENDVLEIDTEGSPKRCKVIHEDGTTENGIRYIVGNPTWFTLKKGYSSFGYAAGLDLTDKEKLYPENVDISINFTNKYLGV